MDVNDRQEKILLLVEDSPGDVRLIREAFRAVEACVDLHVVSDGREARAFLRREGGHLNAPRPDLILLDLNMPRMDGQQFLSYLKADETLKSIPAIILTTSEDEEDVANCYRLQAAGFLTKPVEFIAFETLVRNIDDLWLKRITLPDREAASLFTLLD